MTPSTGIKNYPGVFTPRLPDGSFNRDIYTISNTQIIHFINYLFNNPNTKKKGGRTRKKKKRKKSCKTKKENN